MNAIYNNSISIDCVILGFDGKQLKVLLVRQSRIMSHEGEASLKLPGSMIFQDENLTEAAYRVLEEMTGLRNVFLKQFYVFSDPKRVEGKELEWVQKEYSITTTRVVTVAYYSLLKLNEKILRHTNYKRALWIDAQTIKRLGLDHKNILMQALKTFSERLMQEPIAFELLPKKFTLRSVQNLYEAVFGIDIDNRNFRKKILACGYLVSTNEKEKDVPHKAALLYMFNKTLYDKDQSVKFKLNY